MVLLGIAGLTITLGGGIIIPTGAMGIGTTRMGGITTTLIIATSVDRLVAWCGAGFPAPLPRPA
jgi:hypothetical protein